MQFKAIVFTTILLLGGCSSTVKKQVETLKKTNVCCKEFSELVYSSIKINNDTKVKIDKKSPAYQFESGKAYFKAFQLNKVKSRLNIEIKSLFNGAFSIVGQDHSNDFIKPHIILLDEQYNVVAKLDSEAKYVDSTFTENAHFLLNYESKSKLVKYLIFTTDANNLSYSDANLKESGSYGVSYHLTKIDHAPTGKFTLKVQ